jgi:hypothetical protein
MGREKKEDLLKKKGKEKKENWEVGKLTAKGARIKLKKGT